MIQGERVVLRPPREGDAEESARVWTPELRHMYGGSLVAGGRPSVEGRRTMFEGFTRGGEGHLFCIEAEGRYIGFAIIDAIEDANRRGRYRIGIENPECWGRGYGTEVTRLMLRYAFETLDLHRVDLRVAAYNTRAIRCYEKSGFRLEGVERDSFYVDGQWRDDLLMAALQPEWTAQRQREVGAHGIVIRSYRHSDYEQMMALWENCGFEPGMNDAQRILDQRAADPRGFLLVAEQDGRMVGTVAGVLDRGWGWIQRLAVHPDYRRQGLGRRLTQQAEQRFAALGAYRVVLLARHDSPAAVGLYQSLGYETWEPVRVMSKRLAAEEEEGCCGG
jgi:RimJ/RimL family protein N-acetyltransferase